MFFASVTKKNIFNYWTTLWFALFLSNKLFAVVAVFDHYDDKYGLANSSIKAIVQDGNGLMWVGTREGLYSFDGSTFKKIDAPHINSVIQINKLFIDGNGLLWVGTHKYGLFYLENDQLLKVTKGNNDFVSVFDIVNDKHNDHLWLATDQGIYQMSMDKMITPQNNFLSIPAKQKIDSIAFYNNDTLLIAVRGGFFVSNVRTGHSEFMAFEKSCLYIHDLFIDEGDYLWLATSEKLMRFHLPSMAFVNAPRLINTTRVLSIVGRSQEIWVATIGGGVFQINTKSLSINQFTYEKSLEYALKDKNITSLYLSNDGLLWLGGFSYGLSVLDLSSLAFGFETASQNSVNCLKSPVIRSIESTDNGDLWLGTQYGLIKYGSHQCEKINLDAALSNDNHSSKDITIYSINQSLQKLWISSSEGFLSYEPLLQQVVNYSHGLSKKATFFSMQLTADDLLVGTTQGLYKFSLESQQLSLMEVPDKKYHRVSFKNYVIGRDHDVFLPTTQGLLFFDKREGLVKEYKDADGLLIDKDIHNVELGSHNDIFVSVRNHGVYHFNHDNRLIKHYFDDVLFSSNNQIMLMHYDKKTSTLWCASRKGIIKLETYQGRTQLYFGSNQHNYLNLTYDKHVDAQGKLYFTGGLGFVGFYPDQIIDRKSVTKTLLTDLHLMNELVHVNVAAKTGFYLEEQISKSDHLDFSYKDQVIKLDFVSLNYHKAQGIKYQYKLVPNIIDWVDLPKDNHQLIFSGLKSGDYHLQLRSTDLNGYWNQHFAVLDFTIHPAPWLSWWAFVIYALLILMAIIAYIRHKIAAQKKVNLYLKDQVNKQTQHIQLQNQQLADLIERKNEIFSNVSHEFRTPITLILGPITELYRDSSITEHKKTFHMVIRNAKRLLRLVNQMLNLARLTEDGAHEKTVVNIASRIKVMIEPYLHLAQKSGLVIDIETLDDVSITITEDALEATVGNFLSNAIKYTPNGGQIKVGAEIKDHKVRIYVKDNGPGISEHDQSHIFKRFSRLSQHHSLQGVGIGLALVKEVAVLNGGEVQLESEQGVGSVFSVIFPIHTDSPPVNNTKIAIPKAMDNNEKQATVLVIEDNDDMRTYIDGILSKNYLCISAVDGKSGIAQALKHVPDIIICDVMMPGMNGFQVCRRLRSERVTSHIPLVILTALDEKSSRIKGWRENIDMYLNKPFDAEELNLQIQNILNIRAILSKALQNVSDEYTGDETSTYSGLAEIDQQFILKLKDYCETHYHETSITIKDIANVMFVNERQLQRKVKALIDMTPLDFLREFRLQKASESLKKGTQISIVSDTSGFKSVSYFSQLFKRQYGMTPKQYQKLNQGQDN